MCGPFWRRGADTRSFPLSLLVFFFFPPRFFLFSLLCPSLLASRSARRSSALSRGGLERGETRANILSVHPRGPGPVQLRFPSFLVLSLSLFLSSSSDVLQLARARARHYTPARHGARHESTLGGLTVSSFDSSPRTYYPLWFSHCLGLLSAPLILSSSHPPRATLVRSGALSHSLVSRRRFSAERPASGLLIQRQPPVPTKISRGHDGKDRYH